MRSTAQSAMARSVSCARSISSDALYRLLFSASTAILQTTRLGGHRGALPYGRVAEQRRGITFFVVFLLLFGSSRALVMSGTGWTTATFPTSSSASSVATPGATGVIQTFDWIQLVGLSHPCSDNLHLEIEMGGTRIWLADQPGTGSSCTRLSGNYNFTDDACATCQLEAAICPGWPPSGNAAAQVTGGTFRPQGRQLSGTKCRASLDPSFLSAYNGLPLGSMTLIVTNDKSSQGASNQNHSAED